MACRPAASQTLCRRRLAALACMLLLTLAACATPTAPPPATARPTDITAPTTTPAPTPTSFPEAATAVARATAAAPQPVSAICKAPSGASLTYAQAVQVAAFSECAAAGELLDAHLCNEQTGTWWLGLNAPREGCNPACVVDIEAGTAVINWRCTGLAEVPPTASPLPPTAAPPAVVLTASAPGPLPGGTAAGESWSGLVERVPATSQVRYQLLPGDGQVLRLDTADESLLEVLADAAWRGAPVALRGALDADSGALRATAVLSLGAPGLEPRNLAPFAFPSASSAAPPDVGGTYDAWSAIDGELGAPWCEGRDGPGVGEWLQLDFSAPLTISEMRLSNGYDQEGFLYDSNDQVSQATFSFDGGRSLTWEFARTRGLQTVPLDPPLRTQTLRLTIDAVSPGWEYDDACVGELQVWGSTNDN